MNSPVYITVLLTFIHVFGKSSSVCTEYIILLKYESPFGSSQVVSPDIINWEGIWTTLNETIDKECVLDLSCTNVVTFCASKPVKTNYSIHENITETTTKAFYNTETSFPLDDYLNDVINKTNESQSKYVNSTANITNSYTDEMNNIDDYESTTNAKIIDSTLYIDTTQANIHETTTKGVIFSDENELNTEQKENLSPIGVNTTLSKPEKFLRNSKDNDDDDSNNSSTSSRISREKDTERNNGTMVAAAAGVAAVVGTSTVIYFAVRKIRNFLLSDSYRIPDP